MFLNSKYNFNSKFTLDCSSFTTQDACKATGFINPRGIQECVHLCVGEYYAPDIPERPERRLDQIKCPDEKCPNGSMCNYDYGETGFCEGNN